ncbi:CDP-glucose 4,6-dehydratase [Sulfuriferula nivalis]|uniref:CDP-glucose 4,6-dehydratase n=1 Tax=Sulfuriferula nivalis TaxID=2675298 RepID=A0A809S809_9PROT|nr:CDP-glucose 4,6-dehydratase [Sulfuriferula nivalis]BBO99911.1 CDP-glucose 4,6-dehydratase [Sulfuriferula nivalis]
MENMVEPAFWSGKTVLVTGHTGFKGGWLSLWLQSMGAKVVGFALAPPTHPSLFLAANVADGMVSIEGDIRDYAAVLAVFKQHQPEIVIHMAAQALVRYSYANPVETYATNVMGTVHLFEAARQTGSVRAIVNVTSDKCYENREWVWGYRENEPMGGYDPYSSSKGCAELVTSAYRNSFFNPQDYAHHGVAVASARAGNVIGGGDWAEDRLIPDIIRAITQGEPVRIRSPHAIRPWQHVLEPLSGYLVLAQKLYEAGVAYADAWNFGPNETDAKPVQWIVEQLTQNWGEGASWVLDEGEHPHEAHYLKLDCSKAKARLNWHPRWQLEDALQAIVDWQRAYQAGRDMRVVTLQQIGTYCA